MIKIRLFFVCVILVARVLECQAREHLVSPQMLRDLGSTRWQVRRDAFEHLVAIPYAVNRKEIQRLLVHLRQREDDASEASSPDLFEDDEYLAYDERLTPLVEEIALKTNSSAAWRSLVYSRYNGDSVYGNWIASHRQTLPSLLEQIRSRQEVRRMYAIYVVASMVAKSRATVPFSPEEYKSLKSLIREEATRDTVAVRESAICGLGLIKDPEDASFVEHQADDFTDAFAKKLAADTAREIRGANSK